MHRPETRMMHVDALRSSIAYINQRPLERELEYRQLSDQKILELSNQLEISDSDKFALVDGLVYRKDENRLKCVVPESIVVSLLRAHHNDMAHCGAEKAIKNLQQNYWFSSMRKKVIDNISTIA